MRGLPAYARCGEYGASGSKAVWIDHVIASIGAHRSARGPLCQPSGSWASMLGFHVGLRRGLLAAERAECGRARASVQRVPKNVERWGLE